MNDRIIEIRLNIHRGHSTVVEGREEINEEFYETLQKTLDKVNNNDYIMLIGDMKAKV